MKILGICGAKRVGKDTFYDILKGRRHDVTRLAFADAIKADLSDLPGLAGAPKDVARPVQQAYGTAAKERQGQSYWIDRLAAYMESLQALDAYRDTTFIVTDVRFKSEAAWITGLGGSVVTVERPTGDVDEHQSEQEWKQVECDYRIANVTTLSHYVDEVLKVWRSFEGPGFAASCSVCSAKPCDWIDCDSPCCPNRLDEGKSEIKQEQCDPC